MAIGRPITFEEPVGFHQPDHPRLPMILLNVLERERAMRIESLKGVAKDFADYRYHCGVIEGLDLAISFAKEAKKKAEA